jgi:hypothetical protein
MSNCAHCIRPLTLPPSVNFLLNNFPDIIPSYTLDRNRPRCKHCDFIAANNKAIDAELPPPEYRNRVTGIEKQIELAKSLIKDGVKKEELEQALPQMKRKWADEIMKRDGRIRDAWKEYWGVWGVEKGQEGI